MSNSNAAPANADQALVASPSSRSVSTEGFDPSRRVLAELVADLLDPLRGIERGLLDSDADGLLLNIRAGELRRVGTCLRLARTALFGEDA